MASFIDVLALIAAYAALGGGIKYIDQVYDEKIWSKKTALLLAAACGLLMGYFIATDAFSAVIFVALVLGLSITKKIDNPAFYIGVLLVLGAPLLYLTHFNKVAFNWGMLALLAMACLIDEWGNDLFDAGRLHGLVGKFFHFRGSMKAAVFMLPFLGALPWVYLLAFLAFDAAYSFVEWLSQPFIRRRGFYSNRRQLG